MSWLFGILQKENQPAIDFDPDEDFQKAEIDNLFVAASKNSKTAFLKSTPEFISAFTGVPIFNENGRKKLFDSNSSSNYLSVDVNNLNGHFVWLKYSNNVLEIYTDTFGLRELYYIHTKEQLVFSTRKDLLTNYISGIRIDLKEFSTLWFTNFQLSHNSILAGIKRLGPGGKIIFNGKKVKIENKNFTKSVVQNPIEKFYESVKNYCLIENENNQKISLGLSGGIDARLILAMLIKNKNDFNCHTLVNEENNDLKIARKICSSLGLKHKILYREEINIAEYEKEILRFYRNIPPKIPLTQLFDFGIFGIDYLKNYILIDGGFGEFYRRQYLNKIFLRGYGKFNIQEAGNIKNILFAPKPLIFGRETKHQMEKFITEHIRKMILSFPQPKNKKELSDVLDMISVNFMLPNVYGPGQIVLDQKFISFMPLTQIDTINNGFNIRLEQKSDSKLFKKIIKNSNGKLSRISLVKNNLENSFGLNDKFVMLKLLLDRKFIKKNNFERYKILYTSKEYIMDLLNNTDTKNNDYLSNSENLKITTHFFNGDLSKGIFVDWLLTFIWWSKANKIL